MIEIIQGEKQPYELDLTSKETGTNFDLTGVTDIIVCFRSGSTTVIKKKSLAEVVVVGNPVLGQISGDLLIADTNSLPATEQGDIEVVIDVDGAGDIQKAQKLGSFTVTEGICP